MASGSSLADDYDVVIAGGGMVGASLALLFNTYSKRRCRILLVERFPVKFDRESSVPTYSPSFDARSTALSYGSRLIFESVNVWQLLHQHAAAIDSIHVSRRGALGSTLMDKSQAEWPALGYVVENAWLGGSLMAALARQENITFLTSVAVASIDFAAQHNELVIEGDGRGRRSISTPLVVVADGANSGLRRQLGIGVVEHDYNQHAIIANVGFSEPHRGRAFERFTDRGPLALLPLSDSERGQPRAALVWSLPPQAARAMAAVDEAAFLAQLQTRFGYRLGIFNRVGERVVYPLKLTAAREQVRSGVVIMGNAAHALHPVAGQGFNLALRDCARLASIVGRALADNKNPGALSVLQSYLRQQSLDQQRTIAFSDRLPSLFASRAWPLGVARALGLSALDMLPAVKTAFIRHAAGMFDGATRGQWV